MIKKNILSTDIAICGGALSGLTAALVLQKLNLNILIIDPLTIGELVKKDNQPKYEVLDYFAKTIGINLEHVLSRINNIETLNNMISRSGGYTDQAYKDGIKVFRENNQIIFPRSPNPGVSSYPRQHLPVSEDIQEHKHPLE